jgi:membrane protein
VSVLPTRSHEVTAIGAAVALWSGSMAAGALITTINRAYNLRPRRNLLQQKLLSIWLTLTLSVILALSVGIVLVGPTMTSQLFEFLGLEAQAQAFWVGLRLPIAILLALGALSILYYWAPEAHQRFLHILPGAVTATVFWLAANSAFRLFVSNFGSFNTTYGSLAALVILMAWFWLTGFIFLVGAEINALMTRIEHER